MKPTNPTNPIVVVAFICLLMSMKSFSQKLSKDSLSYYSQVINQPQSAEQLIKAYQFFEQHQHKAKLVNDLPSVSYDAFQLARIHYIGGFYDESETLAIDALQLLDKLPKDAFTKGIKKSIYNHLGMIYRAHKHKEKALELYYTTLKYAESAFDSVIIYNNLSNTYKDVNDYPYAKNALLKAFTLLPRVQDSLTHALVYDNMGFLNYQMGDSTALDFYNKALQIRLQAGDSTKTFKSYFHLANYYKDLNTEVALTYATNTYAIAKKLNNAYFQEEALGILAEIKPQTYYVSYKALNDSLTNSKQSVQNKFATLKYDVSKSEMAAQREMTKRIQYQTIFFVFLIMVIFIIILMRAKAKKQRLLDVYTTETRISKKVHDEIANDLYQVMTTIQATSPSIEVLLDDLEGIYIKTRDISKENTLIDMDQNFDNVLKDLLLTYQSSSTTITTLNCEKINWNKISDTKKHSVYRVLQELMTNMKKHSKASNVLVSFSYMRSKLQIIYRDNGVGCNLQKHTGLQNAENRIKAIEGTITFDSNPNNGFQVTLLI